MRRSSKQRDAEKTISDLLFYEFIIDSTTVIYLISHLYILSLYDITKIKYNLQKQNSVKKAQFIEATLFFLLIQKVFGGFLYYSKGFV